jgi:hypothetical protein
VSRTGAIHEKGSVGSNKKERDICEWMAKRKKKDSEGIYSYFKNDK